MQANLPQVLAALRDILRETMYVTAVRLLVETDEDPGHPIPIKIRGIAGNRPAASPGEPSDSDEDAAPGQHAKGNLHPCVRDILLTLREAVEPLTKQALLEAMEEKRRIYGERTIDKYLALLMDDGILDNPKEARPRGYRIVSGNSQNN